MHFYVHVSLTRSLSFYFFFSVFFSFDLLENNVFFSHKFGFMIYIKRSKEVLQNKNVKEYKILEYFHSL